MFTEMAYLTNVNTQLPPYQNCSNPRWSELFHQPTTCERTNTPSCPRETKRHRILTGRQTPTGTNRPVHSKPNITQTHHTHVLRKLVWVTWTIPVQATQAARPSDSREGDQIRQQDSWKWKTLRPRRVHLDVHLKLGIFGRHFFFLFFLILLQGSVTILLHVRLGWRRNPRNIQHIGWGAFCKRWIPALQ